MLLIASLTFEAPGQLQLFCPQMGLAMAIMERSLSISASRIAAWVLGRSRSRTWAMTVAREMGIRYAPEFG